jgi:hypothetical protein
VGKRLFSVSGYSEIPIFQKAIPRFQPDSNFLEQIKKPRDTVKSSIAALFQDSNLSNLSGTDFSL